MGQCTTLPSDEYEYDKIDNNKSENHQSGIEEDNERIRRTQEKTYKVISRYIYRHFGDNFPMDTLDVIALFYGFFVEFYAQKHGKHLWFNTDKQVTMLRSHIWSTVLIGGSPIRHKMCDSYSVFFKINGEFPKFQFGYVPNIECIDDWNNNLRHLKGSLMISVSPSRASFVIFEYGQAPRVSRYRPPRRGTWDGLKRYFKDGDTFGLCFDFVNDKVLIHHNNMLDEVEKVSLRGTKSLIAMVSLGYDLTTITLLDVFYECKML